MPCQGIPKNPFPTVTTNETDKFRYEICLFLIVLQFSSLHRYKNIANSIDTYYV